MNKTIDISYEEVQDFNIVPKHQKIKFGFFYLTRLLWNYSAKGGKIWMIVLYNFIVCCLILPVTLAIDLVMLLVAGIAILTYKIIKKIITEAWDIIKPSLISLLDTINKKFIGPVLLISALAITLSIIIFRYFFIKNNILEWFDNLFN